MGGFLHKSSPTTGGSPIETCSFLGSLGSAQESLDVPVDTSNMYPDGPRNALGHLEPTS